MDCFRTCFTHVQTCDNVRVQSAIRNGLLWYILYTSKPVITFVFKMLRNGLIPNALHMSKPVITFVFQVLRNGLLRHILYTCPKPVITFVFQMLRNGLLRYILYTCPNLWSRSCSKCYAMDCFRTCFTHVQTCDNVRVQSAAQWTASVHTSHMPKAVM